MGRWDGHQSQRGYAPPTRSRPKGAHECAIDRGMMFNREHYSCLAFMNYTGITGQYTVKGAMNGSRLLYYTEQDSFRKWTLFHPQNVVFLFWTIAQFTKPLLLLTLYVEQEFFFFLFCRTVRARGLIQLSLFFVQWKLSWDGTRCIIFWNMHTLLMMALASITPEICEAFIRDSGYI